MSIDANQTSTVGSGSLAFGVLRPFHRGRAATRHLRALVVVTSLACASLALSGCGITEVAVVNQSPNDVRVSGCFIDSGLDLKVGESATQDFPSGHGRWGCDVYQYPLEPVRYLGCLVVADGTLAYNLERDVDTNITQKACDGI
jgi:hypothetical protein